MPLSLTLDGGRAEGRLVRGAGSSYELHAGSFAAPFVCPLSLPDDVDPTEYDVHIFFAGDVRESDIYQLYVPSGEGGRRIGWFIPLLALESNLHDFAENEHFLRYARAAIDKFSEAYPLGAGEVSELTADNCIKLTALAPESTVLLVISKPVVRQGHLFDLARLYPFLISIGVLDETQSKCGAAVVPFRRPSGGRMRLVHSSEDFANDRLVGTLLTYAAHAFNNPVLQFFYLYQVIELLMEKIFSIEQDSIISKINQARGEVSKVKEAMDDLSECISEKKRINSIVEKYCRPSPSLSELIRSCRDLNLALGVKEGDTLAKSLYPLRNLVFHNYRAFPEQSLDSLGHINSLLFEAVPRILESFKTEPVSPAA